MTAIVWFRQDLRLSDNPALQQAAGEGAVLPVYVMDDGPGIRQPGGASRWWLQQSLHSLSQDLGGLLVLQGDARDLLPALARQAGVDAVYWNRCYEPGAVARDTEIKASLKQAGIDAQSFNGAMLHEPWEVATKTGGPFKVFTPFWRACLTRPVAAPAPRPSIELAALPWQDRRMPLTTLYTATPDWAAGWRDKWQPGEAGAQAAFGRFLDQGLEGYGSLRDRPDLANISRLSPHLHFGEISPRQVWASIQFAIDREPGLARDAEKYLSEIGWREFATHLLYHFPDLPERNWRRQFDAYPWREAPEDLERWKTGQTGYPLVDAGMRELWATGFMHNRVRMVVASFLVKHLRLHWKAGESWFWDTLVDADMANNAAGWQWVTGSGADAAPYFRIFNPTSQAEKFDPQQEYVRRWCPEIWTSPGQYPLPMVDHARARAAALDGYNAVKAAGRQPD